MTRDEDLFADALALPPAERAAFLARACAGDDGMRVRLEELLANAEEGRSFMKAPLRTRDENLLPGPVERAGDRIGRYKLLEKIGEGGCGIVWMAGQEEPVRRRVALKVIKIGMDTREVIGRFEAERQALALMDHPNIARVFDGGATETGRPYFVMELVRGIAITSYCDENHLTTEQRLELFVLVCSAVQHAHQKGVIHRDLKPSNILVTVNNGAPVPKVIDFGVAKATQGRLTDQTLFTAFAQFIGTPVYMSPEQADMGSLDVDTRSDIYSLGVLLYELLTGLPPFDAKTFARAGVDEIRRQIREVEPPPPSTRLRTLPAADHATVAKQRGTAPAQLSLQLRGDLDWIVMRCLEKDRTRRYETANGLALDIQRHMRHEPIAARPPSTAYLLGRLIRRHRVTFAAVAAVGLVILLGAAVSTWQAVRATRAEREQSRLRATESAQRQRAELAEVASRRRAYVSDINLVQQALALDNLGRAQALLDRQRPQSGEPDLRGWEWRYLWQFCQSDAISVLSAKEDKTINSIAVSADGAWLAAGETNYGGLSVWNLRTREEIRVPAGRSGVRVAFSPREPLLAIAVFGETAPFSRVLLWDAGTRRVVREITPGPGVCAGLTFSEDGRTLVTSTTGEGSEITLWRVADGARIAGHPAVAGSIDVRFSSFAVSRDLTLAAYVTGNDRRIHVIDLKTGRERWAAIGAEENVMALAFSPDGKLLASGAGWSESSIRLWDAGSGAELGRMEGNRRFVGQLVFWPDGKTLASAGGDHTIRVWDVGERRLIRTLRGNRSEVNSLALLPDGRTLVSGAKDGSVMFWDGVTDRVTDAAIRIPGGPAAWRFSAASDAMVVVEVTGRTLSRMVERRGRDFQQEKTLLELGASGHGNAVLARDRPLVATWNSRREIRVWNWESGAVVRDFALENGEVGLGVVGFLQGGEKLLLLRISAAGAAGMEERELATGRTLRSWKLPANRPTPQISPDEKYFVVAASQGRFTRIQADAREEEEAFIRTEFATGRQAVLRANTRESDLGGGGFSPDGRLFANGSGAGFVDVIDLASWQRVARLSGAMSGMYAPAFSSDGARLAIGGSGLDSMMLWDMVTFERLLTLPTPNSGLGLVAFSPDGNLIAARSAGGGFTGGSEKGAFYIWRAPSWAEIEAAEKTGGHK